MASFATQVKNELAKLPLEKSCCVVAETLSLFRTNGSMILEQGRFGVLFQTKHAGIAHRFLTLVRQSGLKLATETEIHRNTRLQQRNVYQLKLLPSEESLSWLKEMGILGVGGFNSGGDKSFIKKRCCQRAYLRGAFLGGGSVNKPEGRYHLELVTQNFEFAEMIKTIMERFELPVKMVERKEEYVVYLKEGDAIIHFLQIIGANEALLNFENVRIFKERREYANRTMNCEVANVQKTVDAAFRQMTVIEALEKRDLLDRLPLPLREVAFLRLRYPEESLKDLAVRCSGDLTKSGLNHRFKKLEKVGQEILLRYAGDKK